MSTKARNQPDGSPCKSSNPSIMQADLYAGALFITQATQIEGDSAIYVAILILLAIACVFTVAGGLSAVIYTDAVQAGL